MCEQIEDEIRDHQLVQECMEESAGGAIAGSGNAARDLRAASTDLVRSKKYLKHVQTPIQ